MTPPYSAMPRHNGFLLDVATPPDGTAASQLACIELGLNMQSVGMQPRLAPPDCTAAGAGLLARFVN